MTNEVNRICPLCGGNETFVLQRTRPLSCESNLVKLGFSEKDEVVSFRGCLSCGLIFRTPRPTTERLALFYEVDLPPLESGIMAGMGVSREMAAERNARRYRSLFDEITAVGGREPRHVVDIGGWDGQSLAPWKSAGWRVTLIEPGFESRGLADSGITAFGSSRDAAAAGARANVLTSYHCIEHVLDLKSWLSDARSLSERGTLWVIEVPFEIIYVRGLLNRAPLSEPQIHEQHLNFFMGRSLRSVASQLGLETLSTKMVVTPYWFGPTISLRLYATDPGASVSPRKPKAFASENAMRRYLWLRLFALRRLAGLRFRAYRARHHDE